MRQTLTAVTLAACLAVPAARRAVEAEVVAVVDGQLRAVVETRLDVLFEQLPHTRRWVGGERRCHSVT
ncbi:MAG: hypothetical protein ABEK42_00265 [Thiohalorhabdaceae bacterium]